MNSASAPRGCDGIAHGRSHLLKNNETGRGVTAAALAVYSPGKRHILRQMAVWLEKRHYIFRRYPQGPARSLLFMGCYFPAYFPRAALALQALAAVHGAACAVDCCGKPLREAGLEQAARGAVRGLDERLRRLRTEELITVCPNCHAYLRGRVGVPVRTVYEKLAEWGVRRQQEAAGHLFLPCPDRQNREQLAWIAKILPNYRLEQVKSVQCCGLGGVAAGDADIARGLAIKVKEQLDGALYTYCAACAGQFSRQGIEPVRHLLAEALGVEEAPGTARSFRSRLRYKIKG